MAAVITAKGSTFDTNTGNHTVTATPALNDYIVIVCANSGITASPTVTDNNADGLGTYTEQVSANKDASADKVFIFTRDAVVGSATSTVFTVTGASSTGGGLTVFSITGILAAGTAGVRQVGYVENQATGTPVVAMTRNVAGPGNPIITAVFNDTNPGGVTVPTGYTADYSIGFATPTTGLRVAHHNACPTYTNTITWGGTSASNYGAVAIELDAVYSSVASNLWSLAATWHPAAVPPDQSSVIIAAGDTVTFNVDQTGWTGLSNLAIYGTLYASRTTTSYLYIKAALTINGTGTMDWGVKTTDEIPFAVKATVTGGTNWYIDGTNGLTLKVCGTEPTTKTLLLTGTENIGSTVLDVNASVVGDIWADADIIVIADINQNYEPEERTIAAGGIAAGTITITAGLTAAKSAGAVITLITRNVKFISTAGSGYIGKSFAAGKVTIDGGSFSGFRGFIGVAGVTTVSITVSGGSFYFTNHQFYIVPNLQISGGVFCSITVGNNVINNCNGVSISGGIFTGNFSVANATTGMLVSGGTYSGNYYVLNAIIGGSVSGGTYNGNYCAFYACTGLIISGGTATLNLYNFYSTSAVVKNLITSGVGCTDIFQSIITAFNTTFGSATENNWYMYLAKDVYSESLDHDQTPGKFAAWTKGGATVSATATPPTGFTTYNVTTLADASNEGYWQREITVGAGASVNITMWLRKHISMVYLPRVLIFNKALTDPFAGGATINTFTMTDSIDTWESQIYTYYNATTSDVTLIIRCQGKNASGEAWSAIGVAQINVDLTLVLARLPTALTAAGNMKCDVEEWKTVVPASLTATGKYLQAVLLRWLTDDAAGTPLALTGSNLVQADTIKLAGAAPNNLAAGAAMDLVDSLKHIAGSAGYDRMKDSLQAIGDKTTNLPAVPAALGDKMDLNDNLKNIAGAIGYDRTTDSLEALGTNVPGTPPLLGTDGAVLISTDAQDLSGSLDVNAKTLNGAVPNNLAQADILSDAIPFPGADIDAAISSIVTPGLGLDGNVLISTDAQDLSGSLDVNAKNIGGTAQTGNDIGLDVNDILTDTGTTLPTTLAEIVKRIKNAIALILTK